LPSVSNEQDIELSNCYICFYYAWDDRMLYLLTFSCHMFSFVQSFGAFKLKSDETGSICTGSLFERNKPKLDAAAAVPATGCFISVLVNSSLICWFIY